MFWNKKSKEPQRTLVVFALILCSFVLPSAAPAAGDQRWLILSDIHFNPFDRSAIASPSGTDTNAVLLDSAIAAMRQETPDPSVVVVAGDFFAHQFPQRAKAAFPHSSPDSVGEDTMRAIAQRFDRAFPNAQFLIVLGNNDDPCGDYQGTANSAYLRAIAKIWEPLVNRNGAAPDFIKTFSAGGYYIARIGSTGMHGSLRVVALNSTYWSIIYKNACGTASEHPGTDELSWLDHMLGSTPSNVYNLVLLHIPPGVAAYPSALKTDATQTSGGETQPGSTLPFGITGALTYLNSEANQQLIQLFGNPADHVATVIAGHAHRTEFRRFNDAPMLIVPSISPISRKPPVFFVASVASPDSINENSRTVITDYAAFMYRYATNSWGGVYDFDTTFDVDQFDAPSLLAIRRKYETGWKPPASTQFTIDAFTDCAEDELADFLPCLVNTQRQ
jgi:predicted phosphodiesterase